MDSLKGRVAIVTGASRGIGLGIALALVGRGAKVCLTGRDPVALDRAVRDLGPANAIAVAGRADDPAHQDEAVRHVADTFGQIDMLVDNTGINPVFGPVTELDPAIAAKIMAVNVLAPLSWTRKARDAGMGQHGGSIVNVASVAALRSSRSRDWPRSGRGSCGACVRRPGTRWSSVQAARTRSSTCRCGATTRACTSSSTAVTTAAWLLRRARWFGATRQPSTALWWVPAGVRPDVDQALARLGHLRTYGPSPRAFSLLRQFTSDGSPVQRRRGGPPSRTVRNRT